MNCRVRLQKKLSENCYFKEEMDGGYFLFHSIEHPGKYLGFNRNGKPVNYVNPQKIDKQCRKIFKRITEDSSNGLSTPTIDYELTSLANSNTNVNNNNHPHHHRHKSTRIHQRTHSNRIETSRQRSSSSSSSSSTSTTTTAKRTKLQSHPVRHHHNLEQRHYHTISNNKDNKNLDSNDNMSSTKQLGNEDSNAIYNHNDSGVNIISKQNARHHLRKPTHGVAMPSRADEDLDRVQDLSSHNPTNFNLENNNNDTNNCTDETDDKSLRGRKIVKGRNAAHANDKSNNKCNNNNRRHRKNNENGRQSRRPSQKSSQSHKNQQQANP